MFERTRIDNIPEPSAVPAEVTLLDGSVLKGKVLVPVGKVLADALNSSGPFLEFEPYGGDRRFVAKSQIASLKPVGVPKAGNLHVRGAETFDPHSILGVPQSADWEEIRQSYHKLAKLYHPDRYASASLPDEVGEYLANMVRRVNAAYAALDVPQAEKKAPAPTAQRAAPIYTTGMRA
ncbi:MAG: J domain-containing protein [Hyphomicrobiaceae bacterium]